MRKTLGRLLCALSVMLAFVDGVAAAEIKVTLLGTGTPAPRLSAFSAAKPKLAVYSHIVFATLPPVEAVPEEALAAPTRTACTGPLVIIGRDLMAFVVSDKVEAFAPDGKRLTPQVSAR